MLKRLLMILKKNTWIAGFLSGLLGLAACDVNREGEEIVNRAISVHGGTQYEQVHISFDFRKKHYEVLLDQGKFIYESVGDDSIGRVHDRLSNEGFVRKVNEQKLDLSQEDQDNYASSLNSVVYFALLPYGLNDPAVKKKLIGETSLKGEPYYKIKVTFHEKGGGQDFDDEYVYWIHQENYTVDYLAYSFHVNEGGTRFRQAYHSRGVNGIRFSDHINYESTVEDFALEDYDRLFEEGKVKEFSRIVLDNVKVRPLSKGSGQTAGM